MDKLELDDRVSHLERRVSLLFALLALVIPVGLIGAIMFTARSMPYAPVTSPPVVLSERPLLPHAFAFETELRSLLDLQQQGLITSDDFGVKKVDILGRSMEFGDEVGAVKAAKALNDDHIITTAEYEVLKRKILKLDK